MSKSVVFLCVFVWSKGGEMSKNLVFLFVLWVNSKSVVFLCVFGFCVFLLGRTGVMSKRVVFVKKIVMFLCVFWVEPAAGPRWALLTRAHNLLYNIYIHIYIFEALYGIVP